MSLYAKGPWARFLFNPSDMRTACEAMFSSTGSLFEVSAFLAKTRLMAQGVASSIGINPPSNPRADEQEPFERPILEKYYHPAVAEALNNGSETPWIITVKGDEMDLAEDIRFGSSASDFWLDGGNRIGFWLVLHENTDLDDKNSLREQMAADMSSRPFKSLTKPDQKAVNDDLQEKLKTYAKRTQAAVMLDLDKGDMWVGSGSKKVLDAVTLFFGDKVLLMRATLVFGGEGGWINSLMKEVVAKDLYKLEHDQMVEERLTSEEECEEDPENAPKEDTEYPEGSDCIAVLNMDEVRKIMSLNAPAVLAPTSDAGPSIAIKEYQDALMVLRAMPGSYVGNGIITIKEDTGSQCTVELSPATVMGATLTWRALQPSIKTQDLPSRSTESTEAHPIPCLGSMQYHWLVWFDSLCYCERLIVESLAQALGLDPNSTNVGVVAVDRPLNDSMKITVSAPSQGDSTAFLIESED